MDFSNCAVKSICCIIDFDPYAHEYQIQKGILNTPPSVDAVTITNSTQILLMIEKKTWYHFFNFQLSGSDIDKKRQIDDKVDEYTREISDKYVNTKEIISHCVNTPDVVDTIPHILIFLTELSGKNPDPTSGFATILGLLAMTASFKIDEYTYNAMQKSINLLPAPHSEYLHCKELDNFILVH
ncbi:MAG: hypothetical protein IKV31_07940 [Paludibacteraceae bacterium]|nr:hypothetical protein [Paludibacteraceae bacterium]